MNAYEALRAVTVSMGSNSLYKRAQKAIAKAVAEQKYEANLTIKSRYDYPTMGCIIRLRLEGFTVGLIRTAKDTTVWRISWGHTDILKGL